MKRKKLFGLFLVLLTIGFVSCDNDDDFSDVSLQSSILYATRLNTTYELSIIGGSGDYSTKVDEADIADVSVKSDESGYVLVLKTKKEGETYVTLTDNKTGKSAVCSLFVNVRVNGIEITGITYGVDADQAERILKKLKIDEPFCVGNYFIISPFIGDSKPGTTGTWRVEEANGNTLYEAPCLVQEKEPLPTYFYELIPIEKQILSHTSYKIGSGKDERMYHLVLVKHGVSFNQTMAYVVIYEDLTKKYKAISPDSEVNAVVRAYIFNYWDKKE